VVSGLPPDTFPDLTAANSWISYTNALRTETDQGNVVVKTLPTKEVELKADPGVRGPGHVRGNGAVKAGAVGVAAGAAGKMVNSTTGKGAPLPGMPKAGGRLDNTTVQQRTTPTLWVFMEGKALRAGFPIPCPELLDVNGAKIEPVNRPGFGEGFATASVGNAGGVPIIAASWRLRFVFPDGIPDGGLPVLPNPLFDGADF
jgi:hypothetical protein